MNRDFSAGRLPTETRLSFAKGELWPRHRLSRHHRTPRRHNAGIG